MANIDDDWTEVTDARIPRMDLVGKSANGTRFLLMKDDGRGLLDADTVRSLIADATPTPAPTAMTNIGALLKTIHEAAVRDAADAPVRKADESTADINDLPDDQFAYIEPGGTKDDQGRTTPRSLRHFPLMDAAHVRNAMSRAPQSPFGDKAMPKIHAAAKRYGIDVTKETPMTTSSTEVVKDVDLDASTIPAEPDGDNPGEETDPGSPAWESIDAATAAKWVAILGRAKNALGWLADREATEAATGDSDDLDNAFDLEDAACAIDYAIGTLATFAAGEQLEADTATDALEALGKAAADADAPLAVLEALAPVRKAGRVLSAANEAAIRGAADALQKVLASLPAPEPTDAPEEAPMTMTKAQPTTPDDFLTAAIIKGLLPSLNELDVYVALRDGARVEQVTKAKGDPVTVVFDANGKPLGVIDPTDLVPITQPGDDGTKPDDTTDDDTADSADKPADDGSTPPAPQPDLVQPDANDGPAAAPQTPAAPPADVQKALDEIALLKSTITDAVEAAVAPLRERLENVEKQPMPGGPALNGVIPGASPMILRGQDDGTPDALRKAFEDEKDPIRKQELQMQLAVSGVQNAPRL